MDGFKNGRHQDFELVMAMYKQQLIYFAYKLIENKPEAEDIVLQTFNKLFILHQNFETLANIRAFLYITTRNSCYNYLKEMNKRREANRELYYWYGAAVDDGGLLVRANAELMDKLYRAIEQLPLKCRQVVQLRLKGHSIDSIAEQLDTTPRNVASHWYNAAQQLRKMLISIVFFLTTHVF